MQIRNREDIKTWIEDQSESKVLEENEVDHIADCLLAIFRWYHYDEPLYDPFFKALLSNDLMRTFSEADDVNRKAMYLYVMFLFNNLPMDYKDKIKEVIK